MCIRDRAIGAFAAYRAAKAAGNEADAEVAAKVLKDNVAYFGYGYIKDVNELVPNAVSYTHLVFRNRWKKKRRRMKNMMNNCTRMISHKVRPNVILRKPSK